MSEEKVEKYLDYLNEHITPFIDYEKLHESYQSDMIYALGVLNCLHKAMVTVYGSELLEETDDDEGFVYVPGALCHKEKGYMSIAMFSLDLSSQGEHWGTDYLCRAGIVSQDDENEELRDLLNEIYIPYSYCYTADIPCDIHVKKDSLPNNLKLVLEHFRNYDIELSPKP
jgi:hypothetical protein